MSFNSFSLSLEGDSNGSFLRKEPLLVLYGSQTGNSEQAAEDFCKELKEKFTSSYFRQQDLTPVKVETTCMQLDDFLDYQHAAFTKTLVIFVSSYGVGQAPIGSEKFRSLADELLSLVERKEGRDYATLLKGLRYALCGLGDSAYTTYLVNPSTIDKALTAAGAARIGEMGKADANAKKIGNDAQDKVITRWKEDLYIPLAKALSVQDNTGKNGKEMQTDTIPILMKLDPDYIPPKEFLKGTSTVGIPIVFLMLGLIVAMVAALVITATYSQSKLTT